MIEVGDIVQIVGGRRNGIIRQVAKISGPKDWGGAGYYLSNLGGGFVFEQNVKFLRKPQVPYNPLGEPK